MEYMICEGHSATELIMEIYKAEDRGYKPQGGISVCLPISGNHHLYVQAMIKE